MCCIFSSFLWKKACSILDVLWLQCVTDLSAQVLFIYNCNKFTVILTFFWLCDFFHYASECAFPSIEFFLNIVFLHNIVWKRTTNYHQIKTVHTFSSAQGHTIHRPKPYLYIYSIYSCKTFLSFFFSLHFFSFLVL